MEAEYLFAFRRTMAGFSDSDDFDAIDAEATSSFWKTALDGWMTRNSGLGLTSPAAVARVSNAGDVSRNE